MCRERMEQFEIATPSIYVTSTKRSNLEHPLISDELIQYLELTLSFPIHGLTALTGILTNLLSMIILSRLGLKSSMWVGGFALSLTDFIVTTLHVAIFCCYILNYVYPESNVDMLVMGEFGIGYFRYAGVYISSWIATVISVERCFCVVFPFKVKRLFTPSRCVLTIVVIYGFYICLILPVYIFKKVDWVEIISLDDNFNITRRNVLTGRYTSELYELEIIVNITGAVALSVTSQAILVVCTILMTYALKTSSKIRQIDKLTYSNKNLNFAKKSGLSIGERKLVKVVIGLACVLTVCNIPRYVILAVYFSIPELTISETKNLSAFISDISDFFGTINCSSTFFVYYMLNGNFKNGVKKFFGSARQKFTAS